MYTDLNKASLRSDESPNCDLQTDAGGDPQAKCGYSAVPFIYVCNGQTIVTLETV